MLDVENSILKLIYNADTIIHVANQQQTTKWVSGI